MSGTDYICPNCQHLASENFCPNCGQATHLHKDTFLGLITHFVAHYFHYDSKFWLTLKALITRPGKLTLAYQQKKRQRYIPPISLYIFVSITFFLLFSLTSHSIVNIQGTPQEDIHAPSDKAIFDKTDPTKKMLDKAKKENREPSILEKFNARIGEGALRQVRQSPEGFKEKLFHTFPKVFFFMIPVLALILKLFFWKSKTMLFVDHAVFALHVHSFIFIIALLGVLNPFKTLEDPLVYFTFGASLIYLIIAIKNVYGRQWRSAIVLGILTTALYLVLLFVAMIADIILLFVI